MFYASLPSFVIYGLGVPILVLELLFRVRGEIAQLKGQDRNGQIVAPLASESFMAEAGKKCSESGSAESESVAEATPLNFEVASNWAESAEVESYSEQHEEDLGENHHRRSSAHTSRLTRKASGGAQAAELRSLRERVGNLEQRLEASEQNVEQLE